MKFLNRRGVAVATVAAVAVSLGGASGAWALDVDGTLIETRLTSSWDPPSPDPSGIAYDAVNGRFIVCDGEVEEMTIYNGANLFQSNLAGALIGTEDTQPWSAEPTGVAINPNGGEIYVSDDDERSVFVLDNIFDQSPGVIPESKFTAHGVDPDLEGVAYDSARNEILLANGERGAGYWRVKPGADSQFGTGDDVVDPKILFAAAGDPEGIAYDAARDTVLLLDSATDRIYELNTSGAVLNTIDISGMGMDAAAGIEVAPASDGSGARHYYIVDRGVDNNSDPNENDGRLFEVAAIGLPGAGANQPPTANAGADQVVTLGETATLTGSGTDVETPANQLTFSWAKVSGPAPPVGFGTPNAATTTASFTAPGTYVLRLAVGDGSLVSNDTVTVTVGAVGSDIQVSVPISVGIDDAYQGTPTGGTFVDLSSQQHSIGNRQPATGAAYPVTTGLRFANIPVPQGGEIASARIAFTVDVPTTGPAAFTIKGEAADNAPIFGGGGSITDGPGTTASVPWAPADWPTAGAAVSTPDVKAILQEIVNRSGWVQGNAAVFMIDGTGRRAAKSFEAAAPPVLELTYSTTPAPPGNATPVVNAGADSAVTLPAAASLNGTVTDDGLPSPPAAVTTQWTKVTGPGTVTFGNAALADTTAAFSLPGTYTLRLTADDSALSAFDEVVVTVNPAAAANVAPVVSAGTDRAVTLPNSAPLNGTVTDDGLPSPPGAVTMQWTEVSGPGAVTFADAALVDTAASFSEPGAYTLRLTADDSALSRFDDVVVTVRPEGTPEDLRVTLKADRTSVLASSMVRMRGVLTEAGSNAPGMTVEVFARRAPSGAQVRVGTTTSANDGSFALSDRPSVNSRYFAVASGASSPIALVRVAPRLSAVVTPNAVHSGAKVVIKGRISPSAAGQPLLLQRWNGSAWRTVKKVTRPSGSSVGYRFAVSRPNSTVDRYRVVARAYAGRSRAVAPGNRAGLRVRVYRAQITQVNTRSEFVTVRNTGVVRISLEGWRLRNQRTGRTTRLPAFTLRPGRSVRIHSGSGARDGNDLFLGRRPMWGAHGRAVLRDQRSSLSDRFRF